MVYKMFSEVTKSVEGRYRDMKDIAGLREMIMPVDVAVFSFTGTDPVSSGVCAVGRAASGFLTP
jgi:hypothetical protein